MDRVARTPSTVHRIKTAYKLSEWQREPPRTFTSELEVFTRLESVSYRFPICLTGAQLQDSARLPAENEDVAWMLNLAFLHHGGLQQYIYRKMSNGWKLRIIIFLLKTVI